MNILLRRITEIEHYILQTGKVIITVFLTATKQNDIIHYYTIDSSSIRYFYIIFTVFNYCMFILTKSWGSIIRSRNKKHLKLFPLYSNTLYVSYL